MQIALHALVITGLTFFLVLFSYVYRLFQERGREVSRRTRENAEHYHQTIAPRLKMERRRGVLTFARLARPPPGRGGGAAGRRADLRAAGAAHPGAGGAGHRLRGGNLRRQPRPRRFRNRLLRGAANLDYLPVPPLPADEPPA